LCFCSAEDFSFSRQDAFTTKLIIAHNHHMKAPIQPPHPASFEPLAEFFMDGDEKLYGQE